MHYNSQAFIPEEVERGLHLDLIKYLLDYNAKSEKYYNDIHITTDGYCTIVQWIDKDYEGALGNERFAFVDDDEVIMKEVRFPDNHYEYMFKEDVDEALNNWLKEHPNYHKNDYGRYVEDEEIYYRKDELERKEL